MSCLILIFWSSSSLSYTVHECLTNIASARIQSCSQSNYITTRPARLQYLLTLDNPNSLCVSMLALSIAPLYFQGRSSRVNAQATSAKTVVSAVFWQFFVLGFLWNNYIFHWNYIGMLYVMPPNLQYVLFLVRLVIESFKKVLMRCLAIGSIIVYRTTIIPNTLNIVADCMELRVVKDWST